MFKFQTVISGPGGWVGYLLKETNDETNRIGGINVKEGKLNINIHKGKELTVNELILLFSQLMQNDIKFLENKVYINYIEEQ